MAYFKIVDEKLRLKPGDTLITSHYAYNEKYGFRKDQYANSALNIKLMDEDWEFLKHLGNPESIILCGGLYFLFFIVFAETGLFFGVFPGMFTGSNRLFHWKIYPRNERLSGV